MSFVGPVNKLGDAWVRPHDIEIRTSRTASTREAQVRRIVRLGFEMRVDLVRDDGEHAPRAADARTRPSSSSSRAATSSTCGRGARRRSLTRPPDPRVRLARQLGDVRRQLPARDVGERHVLEHRRARSSGARPRRPAAAPPIPVLERVGGEAAHGGERPLDRADDVGEDDLVRRAARAGSRPPAPRRLSTIPARRRSRRMFSRKLTGMSCASAIRSAGTGLVARGGELDRGADGVVGLGGGAHVLIIVQGDGRALRTPGTACAAACVSR